MTKKQSISDLKNSEIKGKRVFVRADLNVPIIDGAVTDDTRIREAIPTLTYLTERGARVILASHLSRPKGKVVESKRLTPIQKRLAELLKHPVQKTDSCLGETVSKQVNNLKDGEILLLENIRFHKEEESNDAEFSQSLASLADLYVLDGFGTAHRAHASTYGVGKLLPSYSGLLLDKELSVLDSMLAQPARPFVAIIGGAKVSTKLRVLENLLGKVDTLVIGGGMVFTFLMAQGIEVGKSLVEPDLVNTAKSFLEKAKESKTKIVFPEDQLVAFSLDDASADCVPIDQIPADKMGVDIGPKSRKTISEWVKKAQTVLWNGPLGVFEKAPFAEGTLSVAQAAATTQAQTIVGGGDSVAAIHKAGVANQIDHISTGGGATLAYLEGKELPGVSILKDKTE